MQEHDDIDELFKGGLENFRPDASHLSYAPLASAIAAKTTVAGTAVVAKTGFFAKWGMSLYIGLATVATGTGVAVVYAPEQVAVEANSKTIVVASAQVKEKLEFFTKSPAGDTLVPNQEAFPPVEVHISLVESNETEETEQASNPEKRSLKALLSGEQKETATSGKQAGRNTVSTDGTKPFVWSERAVERSLTVQTADETPMDFQPDEMAENPAESTKQETMVQPDNIQPPAAPLDSTITLAKIDTLPSTATDSVLTSSNFYASRPVVWPRSRFSIKAGLGYAPLKTDLVVNQESYIDSMFLFEYYQKVIDRPTIKNEFMASFSYQKRVKSNLQLGVGLSYLQGGWKSFTDYTEYYYVDNGAGGFYLVVDTVKAGERDITFSSISLNLFTGYDFVLGNKWMIGTTIGTNLNQMIIKNDFRNYSTNEVSGVRRADFLIGVYGTADLTYRVTDRLGLSIGASINGRANISRAIKANDFYNSASFGLNGGIHYFFSGSR